MPFRQYVNLLSCSHQPGDPRYPTSDPPVPQPEKQPPNPRDNHHHGNDPSSSVGVNQVPAIPLAHGPMDRRGGQVTHGLGLASHDVNACTVEIHLDRPGSNGTMLPLWYFSAMRVPINS